MPSKARLNSCRPVVDRCRRSSVVAQRSIWSAAPRAWGVAVCLVAVLGQGFAQPHDYLPAAERTNGANTLEAVQPVVAAAAAATVEILGEGKRVSLGTLIGVDGELVAKASELPAEVTVRFAEDQAAPAAILARDADSDLALLRIEGDGLRGVTWPVLRGVAIGQWVVAPVPGAEPSLGVVGAAVRPIERAGGALGVRLAYDRGSAAEAVTIAEVYPESAAARAGLQEGDRIRAVDGEPVRSVDALIERVKQRNPGDTVRIDLERGGETQTMDVVLGYRSVFDPFDRNQRMSGPTSRRRTGFAQVIQHTIPLPPDALGGPLVSLDGEVIGINIARVDRVTTYALPVREVQGAIARLRRSAANQTSSPP